MFFCFVFFVICVLCVVIVVLLFVCCVVVFYFAFVLFCLLFVLIVVCIVFLLLLPVVHLLAQERDTICISLSVRGVGDTSPSPRDCAGRSGTSSVAGAASDAATAHTW